MYVSPVNKTAKNKNVTINTKTLKNALFCPAGTTHSFDKHRVIVSGDLNASIPCLG